MLNRKNLNRLGLSQAMIRAKGVQFFALCALAIWCTMPAAAQTAPTEKFATAPAESDEIGLELSAGGSLNTGNTQSWTLSAGNRFHLVSGRHGFEQTFLINYGQADLPDDGDEGFEDTVRNINAKARYDFFLTESDSLFAAAIYRWDTFAGLDTRLQGQIGYLRNLFSSENHRLWAEAGYDLTYDNLDPDPLPDPNNPTGPALDDEVFVHSARLFLGYDNHINANLTLLSGVEALVNVEDPEDVRVNWDAAVRTSLVGKLKLELKFALKYDSIPVPGAERVDTNSQLNLIYTLM